MSTSITTYPNFITRLSSDINRNTGDIEISTSAVPHRTRDDINTLDFLCQIANALPDNYSI